MTSLVLAFEVVDSGVPGEAHQFKHSTTCRMATPTLLENKMPLLKSSSAFLTRVPCSSRQASFPGKPSPCLPHYRRALGYYVASALCPACWHSRTPRPGSSGFRVPCLCSCEVIAILSQPAIRRANKESVPDTGQTYPDSRLTILVRVYQSVSLFGGNDASDTGFFRRHRSQG